MNTAKSNEDKWCILPLVKIAISDVKASQLLYEHKLYPQAVFFMQQAIEKGLKAINVIYNYTTCKDLKFKVGHRFVKSSINIAKQRLTNSEYIQMIKLMEIWTKEIEKIIEELKEINVSENFISNYRESIQELETSTDALKNTLEELNVTSKQIQEAMTFSKRYEAMSTIELAKNKAVLIELIEYCKKAEQIVEEFTKNIVEKLSVSIYKIQQAIVEITRIASTENNTKLLALLLKSRPNLELEKMTPQAQTANTSIDLTRSKELSVCYASLYVLNIIFEKHETISRYPETTEITPALYTKDIPLMELFSEIIDIVENTLNQLRNLLFETQNGFLEKNFVKSNISKVNGL